MQYRFQQGLVHMPPKRDLERRMLLLPIEEIEPNPNQPRQCFEEDSLAELMQSIAQLGLVQPLSVRMVEERYELVAGERRLRACKMLGMREVPCIVQELSEQKSHFMALAENVQRKELHFLEEAEGYQRLLLHSQETQEQIALRLGKSQAFLSNKLRLLKLPLAIRTAIRTEGLSERHARALLRLKEEALQQKALSKIVQRGLSVKETEHLVETMLKDTRPEPLRLFRMDKGCRLFVNSVKACMEQLKGSGLTASMEERTESDGTLILTISLKPPKPEQPD